MTPETKAPARSARSAGLLVFRRRAGALEVFLVHPGGPYWAKKDLGAWSIPKGGTGEGEDPLESAKREYHEETGCIAEGPFIPLGDIRQKSGKRVTAWAAGGDCDPEKLVSNTFKMEWPPRSGRMLDVPEVDRAEWFSIELARTKLLPAQCEFLDRLLELQPPSGN